MAACNHEATVGIVFITDEATNFGRAETTKGERWRRIAGREEQ